MMKVLQKILFSTVIVVGLSVAAFGQKDDKKKPPKDPPPVVTPQDKNRPPRNPPTDEKKPKKPSTILSFWKTEE